MEPETEFHQADGAIKTSLLTETLLDAISNKTLL